MIRYFYWIHQRLIEIVYNKTHSLSIVGDKIHQGHDYFLKCNISNENPDIFILMDSRGLSKSYEKSLAKMFVNYFSKEKYLLIVRPLEFTTWATLYNTLSVNNLNPKVIITNVGIVDCTPKKKSICESILSQINYFYDSEIPFIYLEEYLLSNGKLEKVYTIDYPESLIEKMNEIFSQNRIYAIKTPIVNQSIKIDRKRPASFFEQLKSTNNLIDKINCNSIDLGRFNLDFTYDAVHWTQTANKYIFNEVIKKL